MEVEEEVEDVIIIIIVMNKMDLKEKVIQFEVISILMKCLYMKENEL
jgi:GTPase SAR1 family protein